MHCINCGTLNSKDSLFCKKCGYSLVESYLREANKNYNFVNSNYKKDQLPREKSKNNNQVNKNYNKKKVINKNKTKVKKYKSKNSSKDKEVVRKMSGFQKFMFVLLVLIVILLMGVVAFLGLYIVSQKTVEVPDVVGLSYDEAALKLQQNNLTVSKKEIEGLEGIVLSQNKKAGSRVLNNTSITITVGVREVLLPNLVGMSQEAAVSILNKYGIEYEIKIIANDEEYVISQSPKAGTNIKDIKKVILEIGKEEEQNTINDKSEETDNGNM